MDFRKIFWALAAISAALTMLAMRNSAGKNEPEMFVDLHKISPSLLYDNEDETNFV